MISCGDDAPRATLTNQEKLLVDSLYKKDLPYLRKQSDSICNVKNSEYFDYFSDSLKVAYINGIHDIQEYLEYGKE